MKYTREQKENFIMVEFLDILGFLHYYIYKYIFIRPFWVVFVHGQKVVSRENRNFLNFPYVKRLCHNT